MSHLAELQRKDSAVPCMETASGKSMHTDLDSNSCSAAP